MHMNLDPFLVDKIVDEVKSQGVFDQFRKDSMSDVDTKPAYQNLRQRVETTVSKFLAEQNWTPEMNKNQLREKLRKHITEAGFLDMGVERIVDQVVNPKISTVFQPKIEDIAYAFLGIEKPQVKEELKNFTNGDLSIKTDFLLTDLEAVSPDSDKVTDEKQESKEDLLNDSDDKNEEFESPPFEPLEGLGRPVSPEKKEDSNHSQLSGISGLTSQDSVEDLKVELSAASHAEVTQESELSAVSSNSRLSIVTNGEDSKSGAKEETDVGISEEAQMPKFSDTTPSNLESGEPLHFDIKKEEIKFEGTDWKSEKRDYYSYMSEELPVEGTVKMEIDDQNASPSKQQASGKIDEPSGSSNLTYSTDTQEQESTKLVDFEKDAKSTSDAENNENPQSSITQELDKMHNDNDKSDKNHTETSKKSDRNVSSSSNKKKTSEKGKQGSSENGSSHHSERRHDSHSPRNHSSSSRSHTSSSYHQRSKSRSHKSKHSRDKDRDRSKDRKHRNDKEKSDKNDEYCSDRKKKYRRKSTDSNEDGDTSKDTSKNNSTASLDKIEGGKESNNSNSSSSYSTKTNGSTEGSSNIPTAEQILNRQTAENAEFTANFPKPVVLDGFLGNSNNKGNIELIIGTSVSVFSKNREDDKEEEPLFYFKESYEEKMHFDKVMCKMSKALSQFESLQTSYLINCEEGFKSAFEKIGLKVLDTSEFASADQKDIHLQSENNKSKENLTGKKKQNLNIPNGKRKKDIEDYYQAAYHVFTDDKIRNSSHSLIIDCFNYENEEHISKKLKTDSFAKVSPTPSELSLGSKENEFIIKNATEKCKDDSTAAKRAAAFKANQRYSSEDLYKPRPVLGQRSRRRALETEVM